MHGPFALDKRADCSWKKLLREATKSYRGLADAAGVYLIATTFGRRTRIRYIGMTHNQGFESEIFSQRNRALVWDRLYDEKNSNIRVWLIAKRTASGKQYCWQSKMANESYLLETLFIMHAKAAGHKLINTAKMKSADGIAVEGLFGKRSRGPKSKGLEEIQSLLAL